MNLGCITQCKRAQFGRSNGLEMKRKLDTLGSVHLGDKFIFRTAEVFGKDFCGRKPSFEGQALTIVRFEPKYKNNIVVRDENGLEFLMRLDMIERGLRLSPLGNTAQRTSYSA